MKSSFRPPQNGQTTEEVNCVPHYDPGLLSISILSTHEGLQLKNMTNNEWVHGPLEPNIGVIWLGEAASQITQNRLKPGIHRVVYPQESKPRLTLWYELCTIEQLKNISADKKDELMANGTVTFKNLPGSAPITVLAGEKKLDFLKRVEMAAVGKLIGHGIEERLPKILIVAHYDALGIANGLIQGADSNASGVLILLKLIRLFSKLYAKQTTRAKYNLHFLFAAGGKLNYQGSKKWIDDYHDQKHQQQLPNDVDVVVCLDSLGQSNELYMHVSKPPKETQAAGILRELLTELSEKSTYGSLNFEQIHKKILKTSDFVAWEHEKYSWSKLPGFTLSHLNSSKSCSHSSISDMRNDIQLESIERYYQYISDALIRLIFNKTDINLSIVDQTYLLSNQQSDYDQITFTKQWLTFLTNYSRSPSLLTKTHPVVVALEQYAHRYLTNVVKTTIRPNKKDPEFVFFDGDDDQGRQLYVYRIKPAIFDLVLAIFIAAYLGIIYMIAANWSMIINILLRYKPLTNTFLSSSSQYGGYKRKIN
ncbi:unnamed protein product [Rotaria sp. Silwood1]|nr:unnamed protein product [Rotaria sp. Silwood1]